MSIYIQITSRCNMTCNHCCFSCTAKGTDMSMDTFKQSIEFALRQEQSITIGGGEPTLHPQFKEFMQYAIWEMEQIRINCDYTPVHIVTNGSNTDIALTLASLARHGAISAAVSHDQYHDPINPKVLKAFEKPYKDYYERSQYDDKDYRGVNGNTGLVIPVGRAKKWGNHPSSKCCCDAVMVVPSGKVYPCGCRRNSIGQMSSGFSLSPEYFEGFCGLTQGFKDIVLNANKD